MSDMSPDDFSAIATPIIQNIARFADQVRPNKCDGVVGGVSRRCTKWPKRVILTTISA